MDKQAQWIEYFRGINLKFSSLYTELLSRVDLTLPQFTALGLLDHAGPMPMTGLSERLHISKPAVTYLVDRLEAKKFVKRNRHPKDRRVSLLEIQPKGRRVVEKTQGVILKCVVKTLGKFSSTDQDKILRFYAALSDSIDQMLFKLKEGKT